MCHGMHHPRQTKCHQTMKTEHQHRGHTSIRTTMGFRCCLPRTGFHILMSWTFVCRLGGTMFLLKVAIIPKFVHWLVLGVMGIIHRIVHATWGLSTILFIQRCRSPTRSNCLCMIRGRILPEWPLLNKLLNLVQKGCAGFCWLGVVRPGFISESDL